MTRRLRIRRPSAGVTVGFVALMVALGGTAGAALPGNNQVFSSDIVNGEVRALDIRAGAVGASEIRVGAVGQDEIATDAVGQDEVGTDAVGADELKRTWIYSLGSSVTAGTAGTETAACPAGMQIVSGGFDWDLNVAGLTITGMELDTNANSVTVKGFNDTAGNRTIYAHAYCIHD